MRKFFALMCFLCTFSYVAQCQYMEAGVLVGGMNYMGDISPDGLEPTEYNLSMGIFARYNMNKYVSFKGSLAQGTLTGTDANNTLRSGLRERNLNFRTSVVEFSLTNEFNITPFDIRDDKSAVPYIFAGITAFHFNPQAQFKGNWYDLQPLGTEGQEVLNTSVKKYSRVSVAIPFGFGFKWNISNRVNLGFEAGARKTITDYLDDVSGYYPDIDNFKTRDQLGAALSFRAPEYYRAAMENPEGELRGNPDDLDWYFVGGLTVSVNLVDNKYDLEWDPKFDVFKTPSEQKIEKTKRKKRKK